MNNCFLEYKNKFVGKRVFLIGNGNSLSLTDLDLIKDEYSIAMNRISEIYEKFSWRPTFYIFCSSNCIHHLWGKEWTKSIIKSINEENTISFIWNKYKNTIDPNNKLKQIKWIKNISENKPNINGDILDSCFKYDIENTIDKTGTTMNLALQIANYMGFSEIYLLGCDLNFTHQFSLDNDPNHFIKNYNADIPKVKCLKINRQMRNIHKLSRKKIPEKVKMYNASLNTVLDIYPIIDYEFFMKNNKIKYREDDMEKSINYWK